MGAHHSLFASGPVSKNQVYEPQLVLEHYMPGKFVINA